MENAKTRAERAKRSQGFSFLDAVIIVVIVGVLTGIGMNRYSSYAARARRPEAVTAFRAVADAQEGYLLTWGRYAGTFDALGVRVGAAERVSPTEIRGKYYTYRLTQPDGPRSWYCLATGNIDDDAFDDILGARNN